MQALKFCTRIFLLSSVSLYLSVCCCLSLCTHTHTHTHTHTNQIQIVSPTKEDSQTFSVENDIDNVSNVQSPLQASNEVIIMITINTFIIYIV